ncbi:hypothetical protein K505DRAFT_330364 [Melanomma pulvis-pyrius CBS 109.77]|uniref:Uncharacterized protein n=1 Tax=Melanomma pulvis-pyrius CBS 109.77 TaxID=1314802 RepID=A0A6A6WR95_9PLEO|nr:hypothetical protein K505DRAFT_330364 [Melanomma pulvis-pyrius CBS 109.77]
MKKQGPPPDPIPISRSPPIAHPPTASSRLDAHLSIPPHPAHSHPNRKPHSQTPRPTIVAPPHPAKPPPAQRSAARRSDREIGEIGEIDSPRTHARTRARARAPRPLWAADLSRSLYGRPLRCRISCAWGPPAYIHTCTCTCTEGHATEYRAYMYGGGRGGG